MTGMTPLELDASCCNRTNWRADLPPDVDADAMEALLVAKGYRSRCAHPALKVLRHPGGHEMAWVTASGRIQIRVDVAVPKDERGGRARALYGDLEECLAALAGGAGGGAP